MKTANNHVIQVYQRRGSLFVCAAVVHSKGGERRLDFVLPVEKGWDGLPAALAAAEKRALAALAVPEPQRQFVGTGRDGLVEAAGCKSYSDFVNGTVACFVVRLDDECVLEVWTPDARAEGFGKKDEETRCDPTAPIETLATVVREVLSSA